MTLREIGVKGKGMDIWPLHGHVELKFKCVTFTMISKKVNKNDLCCDFKLGLKINIKPWK
jgi:hypothetical protein